MNRINRALSHIIAFSLLLLLSACGSKGDLYHEEQDENVQNESKQNVEKPTQEKGQ